MIVNFKIFEANTYNSVYVLREDLEEEFSKYLRQEFTDDFKRDFNINVNPKLMFLLDDDYGIRISNIFDIYQFREYIVNVCTVKYNKELKMFVDGAKIGTYNTKDKVTVEKFVKDIINKLKSRDKTRKLQKYNREVKKSGRQYNL